jgi:hypothetical protein
VAEWGLTREVCTVLADHLFWQTHRGSAMVTVGAVDADGDGHVTMSSNRLCMTEQDVENDTHML